tara:strand:- start:177 stop:398 length:222 start_codon:yes stop_codon:yes gene_type:complete
MTTMIQPEIMLEMEAVTVAEAVKALCQSESAVAAAPVAMRDRVAMVVFHLMAQVLVLMLPVTQVAAAVAAAHI